jgi:hypothetical protein
MRSISSTGLASAGLIKQILEQEEDGTGKKPHIMLDQDCIERGYGSHAVWLDRELTLDHVGFQPEELATVPCR